MTLLARLEQYRLKSHFKYIVLKLKLADTSHLSHSQKKNREHQIKVLESYGKNGVFPKNTNHPGEMVPYFRDTYGTLCAVGYLMWESGEKALVNTIVDSNNHIRVMEITEGPAREWMEKNGLSQEECAEIQPGYTHYSLSYCSIDDILTTLMNMLPIVYTLSTIIFLFLAIYMRLIQKKIVSYVFVILAAIVIYLYLNFSNSKGESPNTGSIGNSNSIFGESENYGIYSENVCNIIIIQLGVQIIALLFLVILATQLIRKYRKYKSTLPII